MIIDIILPLSLVFIMFTLGIGLTIEDFKNILREPKAFGLGIINQMMILPIVAFFIVSIVKLPNEMAVGIMILACCPGGVTSNIITKLAKGDIALSISYTAVGSIASVITLPLIVGFSMQHFLGSNAPTINILSLGLTIKSNKCLFSCLVDFSRKFLLIFFLVLSLSSQQINLFPLFFKKFRVEIPVLARP